jgi:hypothetical protein
LGTSKLIHDCKIQTHAWFASSRKRHRPSR